MDSHSQLTSAVLDAAQLLDTVPDDLVANLAALKARIDQEPSRTPEDELALQIENLFGPAARQYAEQIFNNTQPDTSKLDEALLVALLLALIGAATANTLQRGAALGVELSIDRINQAAVRWAQDYTFGLVRGINETTRRAISDAIVQYAQTPGMTKDDVARLLEPTFGKRRAETIATTEITRAYSQAAQITQSELADQGVIVKQRWVTWHDDRVCPICAPLHNSFDYDTQFIFGPPGHVGCRCWLESVKV